MSIFVLYATTFAVFLGLDFLGLSYVVKPVFERDVGHMLAQELRLIPAVLFYAFFIACLLWFVSWPAIMQGRSLWWVFGSAALLGAMAYGTYEFTNLATLSGWSWRMVLTDLTWGTVLTGVSANVGVAVTRAVT